MVAEKTYRPITGWIPLAACLGLLVAGPWLFFLGIVGLNRYGGGNSIVFVVGGILLFVLGFLFLFGFMAIAPNQARVLLLFGEYKGSALESGFFWVNPFFSKKKISLRVRNFETGSIHTPEQKDAAGKVLAGQEPHRRPAVQGQRPRRQSDRHLGGGGVAGRQHGRGAVRGG